LSGDNFPGEGFDGILPVAASPAVRDLPAARQERRWPRFAHNDLAEFVRDAITHFIDDTRRAHPEKKIFLLNI